MQPLESRGWLDRDLSLPTSLDELTIWAMDEVVPSRINSRSRCGGEVPYVLALQTFLNELAWTLARDPSSFPDIRVLAYVEQSHVLDLSVVESACQAAGRRFQRFDTILHLEVSDTIRSPEAFLHTLRP